MRPRDGFYPNEGTTVTAQERWAHTLVQGLVRAGVQDVVISPGSRSTPIVHAVVAHESLRYHHVVDERSAAFFALGQARVTDRPTALLCTSGTAAAHYLPAVIEASQSFVPLLVISADRPPELHQCGANQTVAQGGLFRDFVRHAADLGSPPLGTERLNAEALNAETLNHGSEDVEHIALRSVFRKAVQCVAATRYPVSGPVHLNVPARKPLEPGASASAPSSTAPSSTAPLPTTCVHRPMVTASDEGVRAIMRACSKPDGSLAKGIVVAGPASLSQIDAQEEVQALSDTTGFPLWGDATSQLRALSSLMKTVDLEGLTVVLGTSGARHVDPEVIVQLGHAPIGRGWERMVSRAKRVVLTEFGWPDPSSNAESIVIGDLRSTLHRVVGMLKEERRAPRDAQCYERWQTLARCGREARDEVLARAGDRLTEGGVVRAAVSALPNDSLLVLGNSLPVRHADVWADAPPKSAGVLSQRGASGIDGAVSGATGAAQISGRPTLLVVGDVSLAHDLGGLMIAARCSTPLVVVVIHNNGGRIFEQLPVAERTPELLPHLVMPDMVGARDSSFQHAAECFGVRYERPTDLATLKRCAEASLGQSACTLIEARVPDSGAQQQASALDMAIEQRLETCGLA